MRRYLLRASALSVGTMLVGCGSKQKEPIRGNPKGSIYEQGPYDAAPATPTPPDAATPDAGEPIMPGNPKGALYDDGAYEKK